MSALSTVAGVEVFKKVVSSAYEYCSKGAGLKLKQWNTERQMETLYKRILAIRKVKTIWQLDKSVDLFSFYCDSHLIINDKRIRVKSSNDLELNENVLIQGIAGQGKSILLRYICAIELTRGEFIPIFIELSRIRSTFNLMDRIEKTFQSLGLAIDSQLFDALASSGKILLLLDAFDEIPDELKTQVLTDIEDLAARYDKLKIVVTSRPNHKIQVSNHFRVVKLDDLKKNEYKDVIIKLANKEIWAHDLIEHIEKRAVHVKSLLCTPLIVTLLVISYKSYKKLPGKLSDFYDSIFITLLQRHDGTKPSCIRPRSCDLDDNEYRLAFEAFCISAKKSGHESLQSNKIYKIAKEALDLCSFNAKPLSFIDDIVKITCLLVKDGEEYRFIHNTVREYYTASYVQKKPDSWANTFYTKISKSYREWHQELDFLSEIDSYRYNRYYKLPAILNLLNITEDALKTEKATKISLSTAIKLVDEFIINYDYILKVNVCGFSCAWTNKNEWHEELLSRISIYISTENMVDILPVIEKFPELVEPYNDENSMGVKKIISLSELIQKDDLPKVNDVLQAYCDNLFMLGKQVVDSLENAENPSFLDDLL